jgi:hypothetical protein
LIPCPDLESIKQTNTSKQNMNTITYVYTDEGTSVDQGCQMVSFQTKNPNLCKLCVNYVAMEDAGIFYVHLVSIPAIWHI